MPLAVLSTSSATKPKNLLSIFLQKNSAYNPQDMTINQIPPSAGRLNIEAISASSMTGYGNAQTNCNGWLIHVELRCVNSRFLDLNLKIPEEYRTLEAPLREMLQARLARGKVECRIIVRRLEASSTGLLDSETINLFSTYYQNLKTQIKDLAPPTVKDILEWAQIGNPSNVLSDTLHEGVLAQAQQALEQLMQTRLREGTALAQLLVQRSHEMLEIAAQLKLRLPQVLQEQQKRVKERLEGALGLLADRGTGILSAEEIRARITQEVVIIGMRIDVAEELDRLIVHCEEILRLLTSAKPVGKRLDFVIQELNREANTLGSKMVAEDFSKAAIELKVLIEQMREQVQNLE